jgi:hypothetical protein
MRTDKSNAGSPAYYHTVVSERAPQAVLCLDAFYADLRIMPTWRLSFLVGTLSAARRSA